MLMAILSVGQALVLLGFPVHVKALRLRLNKLLTHAREKQWRTV
jgi:hypothetical protein